MRRGLVTMIGAIAIAALASACPKENNVTPPAADASTDAASTDAAAESDFHPGPVLEAACFACHTQEMIKQQRLTQAQWTKVITKMVSWGAVIEAGDVTPLARYLAETCGPDAGPYVPATVPLAEALVELEPTDDKGWPAGDSARGQPLWVDKCSGCHAANARGGLGVNLVERPILYRIEDFARVIREGRSMMKPIKLEPQAVADILAHLRTLRVPPPPPP